MDWNYSNPLSDALLAARTNQSDLRFGNSPLYRYSNFDPLITKFKTRPNYYNRPIGSMNLFDDIDELALQVETENLLTSRYRPMNQLNYIPSYFNNSNNNTNNQASVNENNFDSNSDLFENGNNGQSEGPKNTKIPKQPPKPNKKINKSESLQNKKKTQNQDQNQNRQLVDKQIPVQAHNSQQQRFIQYQQRLAQQQPVQQQQLQHNDSNLSELEILKIKQQQDRQQLLASLGQKQNQQQQQQNQQQQQFQQQQQYQQFQQAPIANQNIYAPFFQPNYLKTHKQYSETSIPSTNADPLNSNNPTPPLFAQRNREQDLKPSKFQTKSLDDEPGSYLNTLKETRLREQRLAKDKYTANDYKKYQKNYGFGRDFLPFESETKEEKMEKAKKRDEYAKLVKERNNHLTDRYTFNDFAFQKRNQNTKFAEPEPAVNKRVNRK